MSRKAKTMLKSFVLGTVAVVSLAIPAAAAYKTDTVGGTGGEHYFLVCNSGILVGLRFGLGDNLDHVSLICSGDKDLVDYYDQDGDVGGGGGSPMVLKCEPGYAVKVLEAAQYNSMVGGIGLICENLHSGDRRAERVEWSPGGGLFDEFTSQPVPLGCREGFWAQGIQGSAGDLVDLIGLVCAEPKIEDQSPAAQAPEDQSGVWSAFSSNGRGNWGYAARRSSEALATDLAMQGCGGTAQGCQVFWTTEDACVAYSESRDGGYWYAAGGGKSLDQASANALRFCQSGTAPANSCQIAFSGC